MLSGEATLLVGEPHDATLQVALERALEAFRASAGADTLAVFDLAHEATETAQQPRTAARLEFEESNQSVEAAESEPAPLDSSEPWFEAIEAFEDAVEAAEDAAAAGEAANAAAAASHGAAADARDADWAWAILNAAAFDGDWEAMTADIESHLAAALAAVRAAENFEREALEAQAAAAAAAAAALTAAEASEAARAVAQQSGATEGAQAYWDAFARVPVPKRDAEFSARGAAASAGAATRTVVYAARTAEDVAWYAARFFASVDAQGVAAFKESLQQSCQ